MRFASVLTVLAAIAVLLPCPVAAQRPGPPSATALHAGTWGRVEISDPVLRRAVDSLASASEHFARGMDSLRAGRFPVHVLNTEQYRVRTGEPVLQPATVRLRYAEGDRRRVVSAFVIVDSDFLRMAYSLAGQEAAFGRDLQLLLSHELYGHLAPGAASGRKEDLCFDPGWLLRRISPAVRGCPTDRENLVRADLGLPERPAYTALAMIAGELWGVLRGAYSPVRPSLAVPARPLPPRPAGAALAASERG